MVKAFEPEEREGYLKVAQNPAIKGPLQAFVQELANEGVLQMFIDPDKIASINLLLEAKGIDIANVVERDTYINTFAAMILGHVTVNMKKEPGKEVDEGKVKEILDHYIDNVRWSRIFEIFWGYSFMLYDELYRPYIEAYKNAEGTNQNEKDTIDRLFNDAFPAEKKLSIPGKKWEEERVRNLFDLSLYLKDEYIDEVFGSIQRINKKTISSDMRESIDIFATSCVEVELFMMALKELHMTDENVDVEALRNWLETVKVERRLCIMTFYYLFAHRSFALLAGKK